MKSPDINLLLHAVDRDSRNHDVARVWLEQAFSSRRGVGFAWGALLGFLRLSTKSGILRKPLAIDDAFAIVQDWLAQPSTQILHPTERHAELLARLLVPLGTGGNLVQDAHLAALAIEHGAEFGSFDADFHRFAGLRFDHLAS